jgi:hypothetical protein
MQIGQDEYGILDEYEFAVFFSDSKEIGEIAIEIDETLVSLFESHPFVKVFIDHLDFCDFTYTFTKRSGLLAFETQVPKLRYICIFPEFNFDQEVVLSGTTIKLDNGVTCVLSPLWEDSGAEKFETRINGAFIEPGVCRVFMEKDSIVCFDYGIKKRFVASIVP